jgi:hypothetical protein
VTACMTRSVRSSVVSLAKSSGPSFAMQAWWTRVFSSAYGSCAASCACGAAWPPVRSTTALAAPFVVEVERMRSWRPMVTTYRS